MNQPTQSHSQQYRDLTRKHSIFQLLTLVFMIAGLLVSVSMIAKIWNQGVWETTLRSPEELLYLIIPLLPSFALSFIAGEYDKKIQKLVAKANEAKK